MKEVDPRTNRKTKKVMLLILCEEGSNRVVIHHIKAESALVVQPIFTCHVAQGSIAHTDGAPVYGMIPGWGDFQHASVNHSAAEFVRYEENGFFVSSNKAENNISTLKKGI